MKIIKALQTAALLALTLAATSAPAASIRDLDKVLGKDGLQKVKAKDIEVAYVRPGSSLAAYKRVKLDPVEVEFAKSWNPERTGSSIKLSSEEREKIRAGIATLVQEEFAKALQKSGTYQVTTDAGPDVLRVKANILNLYVNAPDVGVARSRTLVSSAGEMTLLAELFDSSSGQVLARIADRRESNMGGRMFHVNGMVNRDEARRIAARWGEILRKALDKAHGIGPK